MEIERRKQRWLNFYRMDGETRFLLVANYDKGFPPTPMLWYEKAQERVDWAYRCWQAAMEETRHVDDDYVPSLNMITGTEIFAEALGAPVHYPEDNNPCALPFIHSAQDVAALKVPRWEDTRLAQLFDMADKLRSLAGPGALLHLPDIQSPLDIAALLWEKTSFYPALIEEPEAVHELVDKVKPVLYGFLDAWFARYGTEYVAHFPDYYMQGGVTLSEDEIGAFSPKMFREFALPTLVEMSERYGGMGMHCCADSEHQWANIKLVPNLRLLNLVRPIESARDSWTEFCGHTALYSLPGGEGDDVAVWPAAYPRGSHAVLSFDAKDRDDARRKLDAIRARI